MRKRHTAPAHARATPSARAEVGGVIEGEGPVHISNVMLLDPSSGEPTRVGVSREGGRRSRVARKRSGERID